MRVLVIGGTSLTGPHLVRELLAAGHEMTVFHRGDHEHDLVASARHIHGDVNQFERHLSELLALRPEVVVDLLAFRPEHAWRVHAFKGVAERAVLASSADVYRAYGRIRATEPGDPDPVPLTEDSPLREIVIEEWYDKVGVEREAQSDEFPVTVLRFPAIHGPGDRLHRVHAYVKRMDDERPAILLEKEVASWRWVRGYCADVGHATALAVTDERSAGRAYNVCEPECYSEAEWVRRIAAVHGWDGEVVVLPTEQLPPGLRQSERFGMVDLRQDYVVDSTRIRAELGYEEPTEPKEALRRTIEWERKHPPDNIDPADFDYAAEDAALAAS